ncbi:MAG: hypothetical protein IJY50_04105 [Clostridia bacterium]|nr:hypothetical protein [Clostridia bacterium]
MTKAKKKILKISISISCVVLALFSVFWFFPHCRHWNFKKDPISLNVFLPYPDSIVCRIDGKNNWLNEEEREKLYEQFAILLDGYEDYSGLKTPFSGWTLKGMQLRKDYIEFRYDQRQKYTGSAFSHRAFEYDACLIIFNGGNLIVVPYLGCTYRGTIGFRCLSFENTYYVDFENYVMKMK